VNGREKFSSFFRPVFSPEIFSKNFHQSRKFSGIRSDRTVLREFFLIYATVYNSGEDPET